MRNVRIAVFEGYSTVPGRRTERPGVWTYATSPFSIIDGAHRFPTAATPRCIKGAGIAKAEKSSNEIPHAADYRPVGIPWLFKGFGKDCGDSGRERRGL